MVKIDINFDKKLMDTSYHGAFTSFRSASKWLVDEGFETYYDDDLSELFEEEIISFIYVDKGNNEKHSANIETFSIQN